MDLSHVQFQGTAVRRERRCRAVPAVSLPHQPVARDPEVASADDFAGWVLRQAGLVASRYRAEPLARRVPACLRALKVKSPDEARALLADRPGLLDVAVDALLNGTTAFFRDPAVFDAIATTVLPAIASASPTLRILCAACSSGPEAYSLAMLLDDAGLLHRAALVATDCRDGALARARVAKYDPSLLAPVPQRFRDRYFEPSGDMVRPIERIRHAVTWTGGDVTSDIPPGPWDLVVWRNAAMYLAPAAMEAVLAAMVETVRPGGFLVLGKAERPPASLRLSPVASCVYRRELPR